ncbi:MAG: hypothetical protein V3W18_09660 [candidate division Zixibacteria bacterium]
MRFTKHRRPIFSSFLFKLAIVAAVLWLISIPVSALDFTDGAASGTVLTIIAATSTQDLAFGSIFQGVPKLIGYNNDAASSIFTITGEASAGINLQLILPEYVSLSGGSDRMTIIFSSTDAAVDTTTATPSTVSASDGWINQNPYNLPASAVIGSAGTTRIYLGGKIVPSIDQTPGAYSGDIVLSVSYNGT